MAVVRRLGWSGIAGGLIVVTFLVVAVIGPWIVPHDPLEQHLELRRAGPSRTYLLGNDEFGRDILSRLIIGARTSLLVGGLSVLSGGLVGTLLGIAAGYAGRFVDEAIMRLVDVFMAFPYMLLAIAVVGLLGPGLTNTVIALALFMVPTFARIARGTVLEIKEETFVEAARSLGAGHLRVLARHILPGVLPVLLVQGAISFSHAILVEASLSFLGLGVPPPDPSWGGMVSGARSAMRSAPHVMAFPAAAIGVTLLGLNLLADALRDWLDPRMS